MSGPQLESPKQRVAKTNITELHPLRLECVDTVFDTLVIPSIIGPLEKCQWSKNLIDPVLNNYFELIDVRFRLLIW